MDKFDQLSDLNFHGRVAVVTGAASGIGRATSIGLARRGAKLAVMDRDEQKGRELADELNEAQPTSTIAFAVDVSNCQAVEEVVSDIRERFEHIDLLAHCAGVQSYGTAVTTNAAAWHETLSVDLDSAFYVARTVIPHMQRAGRGSIVFTGSTQSQVAHRNSVAYVTGKHAIVGLMRSVALDFAKAGVRCNCVLPGAIDTPMIRWGASRDPNPQRVLDACSSLALLGRMGTAEEVANVIIFLLSDLASFITGASIVVDGGQLVPCGGTAFQLVGTGAEPE
jgi:NAD(P)-dependent dehydrogenase (short-subunit alcohol dehydrogenase family)